jgi:GNAT superfamily N-acetyltransferase
LPSVTASPPDFPSLEAATELATSFIAHPAIYGVAAEDEGKLVASNFLTEGDPIRAVGPITIDPAAQGRGIGRQLMRAVIDRGQEAIGIRLVQDAFNTRSLSLYAALGFEVKEPLGPIG